MSTTTITVDGNPITLVPLPASPAPRMVEPWAQDSVAMITFPFTGQTQAQASSGADLWGMMVTYPPLTPTEASPLLAWLLGMRGMFNAVQMAPPEYTGPLGIPIGTPVIGAANLNLVPDSSLLSGFTDWTNPGTGWSIVAGPSGGGGTNAFQIASGNTAYSTSTPFAVVPGQTYTLSCYIQAPAYGTASIGVEVQYAGSFVPLVPEGGTSRLYTVSFAIPAGITSANIYVSAQGATWTSGTLLISSIQLQTGAYATSYIASTPALIPATQVAASTSIITSGWAPSTVNLLLPFDCIQIGYRLYRVLDTVDSDANGNATFRIWPSLREDQSPGAAIICENPLGLFRLAANKRNWSTDYTRLTHLSFPLVEYR